MTISALRLGIVSLGLAGRMVVDALQFDQRVELVGGADPDQSARSRFTERTGCTAYLAVEELCDDANIDVIWVASPTRFHREHVEMAAAAGKDVIVEKPMAPTVADCDAMISAASDARVTLLSGGVRSLDPAFKTLRKVVESGIIGELRRVTASARTGWLTRPRSAADLDDSLGGGIVFNQAPHQVDVVRLLAGGRDVLAVTATSRAWSQKFPHTGHFRADLEFADGVDASISNDGHGYLTGVDERGTKFGQSTALVDAGLVLVDGTKGAARLIEGHVVVETDAGMQTVRIPDGDAVTEVISELLTSRASGGCAPVHTGKWGRETLKAVSAIAQSAQLAKRLTL